MLKLRHLVTLAPSLVWLTVTSACGPSSRAPIWDAVDDQTAYVGEQFVLELRANDPEGADLVFHFNAPSLPALAQRGEIVPRDRQSATFRWTPLSTEVGIWDVDFEVSDGFQTTVETVTIEVMASPSTKVSPVFQKPTGNGTTLDLAVRKCLDLEIEVVDTDSTHVTIAEETPRIEGATLTANGDFKATWHWCPTQAQIDAKDRYALQLSATDESSQKTLRPFLIIIKRAPAPTCTGTGPVIAHTPMNVSQVNDLTIDADITDDKGLKGDPILYWSLTQPPATPDVGAMSLATMMHISGATYAGDVPNPVATMPAGTKLKLYYLFVAQDNDDPDGSCNHTTQSQVYSIDVENPGTQGGLGPCSTCSADTQCGGATDNCIHVGQDPGYYCGKACTQTTDCPQDYDCPATAVTSINGVTARQCAPIVRTCNPETCTEDTHEEDDTRDQAASRPELDIGSASGKSCPQTGGAGIDEDWYKIVITDDSQITVTMTSGAATDLDLQVVDSAGGLIQSSRNGPGVLETITTCLVPGTYYAHVFGNTSAAENSYTLSMSGQNQQCAVTCTPDANEEDDTPDSANVATVQSSPKYQTSGSVCSYDSDWFWITLAPGQTLRASLTFAQSLPSEDIDMWLWDETFTVLTKAESYDSNEYLEYTPTASGVVYLEVFGYEDFSNTYSLCLSINSGQCPVYTD